MIPLRTFEQTGLQDQHMAFLKTRGISDKTAIEMKLFSANKYFGRIAKQTDAIGFPYFKGGQYIASKYRSIEAKDFTQDSGGSHIFFGIDKVDETRPLIIVEGEIDALTLIECGITNGVSVPSGAPVKAVAADAGYATPSAFIAAFRKTFGVTPARYFGALEAR